MFRKDWSGVGEEEGNLFMVGVFQGGSIGQNN